MIYNIYDIPLDENVLFDSNIFIYSALNHPSYGNSCTDLITKVENKEIKGFVPTIVINEVLHRLMIAEIIRDGHARNTKEAIDFLKNNSSSIPQLEICWEEVDRIYDMNFIILTEKSDTFKNSIALSKKYSLMAKDAYIASFAKSYNICNIATNDSDFTRVDFLTVWRP